MFTVIGMSLEVAVVGKGVGAGENVLEDEHAKDAGGFREYRHTVASIQAKAEVTRAYTPGKVGLAQTSPL
jgi:hypothetical protein